MSIWAEYRFETTADQGLKLALQEWDVIPTQVETGGRIKAADEPLRQKLKARFEEIFTDVELDPLQLMGQFEKAGKFAYSKVDSTEGWLAIHWDQIPGTAVAGDRVAAADGTSDSSQKQ